MFYRISFIPKPFPRKQKQKQVRTNHIWICEHLWHLWPKCDRICFAKKTQKKLRETNQVTNSKWLWHFVTITNVTNCHTLNVTGTNPISVSICNPDQNDCQWRGWRLSKKGGEKKICWSQPKKKTARAGWPKRLGLVRATPWADFAVITDQLWSTVTVFFPCVTISW